MRVMLIGNPNCGKTTLFNALTGDTQRVGNWPGVTVEKKTGLFQVGNHEIELIDLPGLYSLTLPQQGASQDERITVQALTSDEADVIINVIDACHLERHLYLTSQLLELGKPTVIALNMIDIAQQRGISIDVAHLAKQMGCPILPIEAHRSKGLEPLKQALVKSTPIHQSFFNLDLPPPLKEALKQLQQQWIDQGIYSPQHAFFWANRLMEGDTSSEPTLPAETDILMADARYKAIHQVASLVQNKQSDANEYLTSRIDRVVLHRFWALPIFFGVMYLMFFLAVNVGGAFQDFFDISSDAIFVQGLAVGLNALHVPQAVTAFVADGLGKGINTTLTFIPVLASMYFFLALLETSGYMARAAFVVDKAMRALGLPGKAFVPMIVGFGCNVPAIMAARTLDSERDRLLTVLMSPFMSCSARLAIYAIFVAAFFPVGGHNVIFSLYLVGILMAVLTGCLLRNTLFKDSASPLLLELPAYHKPSLRRLTKETSIRLRFFITRAGRLIIPICIILGGLNAWIVGPNDESILSLLGQSLTPIFAPMGIQPDNWPATMGLITGMLAKEVVVGTLHTLYTQAGHIAQTVEGFNLWATLQSALMSIPQNLAHLTTALIHPLTAQIDIPFSSALGEIMVRHFNGPIGAYAYLLFVLLYIPCVSTMAVIRQEAGRKLMIFSIIWSLALAYGVSVGFYQVATLILHPLQTMMWLVAILATMGLLLTILMKWLGGTWRGYAHSAS